MVNVLSYSHAAEGRWGGAPLQLPLLPSVPAAPVDVFVVYDDLAAGQWATDLVGKLAADAGGLVDFRPVFWRLDVLNDDDFREAADDDAVAAEVILIGMAHAESCAGLEGWLERTLVRRASGSTAIVVLVPASPAPAAGIDERIEALARMVVRHGVGFFVSQSGHGPPGATV